MLPDREEKETAEKKALSFLFSVISAFFSAFSCSKTVFSSSTFLFKFQSAVRGLIISPFLTKSGEGRVTPSIKLPVAALANFAFHGILPRISELHLTVRCRSEILGRMLWDNLQPGEIGFPVLSLSLLLLRHCSGGQGLRSFLATVEDSWFLLPLLPRKNDKNIILRVEKKDKASVLSWRHVIFCFSKNLSLSRQFSGRFLEKQKITRTSS